MSVTVFPVPEQHRVREHQGRVNTWRTEQNERSASVDTVDNCVDCALLGLVELVFGNERHLRYFLVLLLDEFVARCLEFTALSKHTA